MSRKIIFFLLSVSLFTGCLEDSACASSTSDQIEITFRSIDSLVVIEEAIDSVYITSPQTLLAKEISSETVDVYLVPEQEEVKIVFKGENLDDSLRFSYSILPKLYAPHCDVVLEYVGLEVLESTFDSLGIQLNQTPPRIEVYY